MVYGSSSIFHKNRLVYPQDDSHFYAHNNSIVIMSLRTPEGILTPLGKVDFSRKIDLQDLKNTSEVILMLGLNPYNEYNLNFFYEN